MKHVFGKIQNLFRINEIEVDQYRIKHQILPLPDSFNLRGRIIVSLFLKTIKFPYKLGQIIVYSPFYLGKLIYELDRLHFSQVFLIKKGRKCVIDVQSWIINGKNIQLGDCVKISAFSSIMAGYVSRIKIGSYTIIGPGVTIVSFNHGYKSKQIPIRYQSYVDTNELSITIEDNVWIGAGSIILPGSTIGSGTIIAAGSIVKGKVGPNSVFKKQLESSISFINYND